MVSQRTEEPRSIPTFSRWLGDAGRRAAKQIGWGLAARTLLAGPLALLAWFLHTFLLVYVNEGSGVSNPALAHVLALDGLRMVSGTLVWGVGSFVVSAVVTRAVTRGPVRFAKDVLDVPGDALGALSGGHAPGGLAAACGGAALGVVAGTVSGSRVLALLLAVAGTIVLAGGARSPAVTGARLAWVDLTGAPKEAVARGAPGLATVGAGGLLAGLAVTAIVPFQPFGGVCAAIALGVLALLLFALRRGPPRHVAHAAALLALTGVGRALADDGGWDEGGGTLLDWLRSPGALAAVLHGLPPALASFVGVVLGSVPGLFPPIEGVGVGGARPGDAGALPLDDAPGGPGDKPYTRFHGGAGPGRCGVGLPNWWVSTADRALWVQDVFLRLRGRCPRLELRLAWSGARTPGLFGRGWRSGWEVALAADARQARVRLPSGRVVAFAGTGGAGDDGRLRLVRGEGGWTLEDLAARTTTSFGRRAGLRPVESVADRWGNTLTFERDARGRLARVVDAAGRAVTLTLDDAGRCTAIALPDGRSAHFAYDAAGDLVQTTDLAGIPVRYAYVGDRLVSLRAGDGKEVRFAWDGGAVNAVTDAAGQVTRYDSRGPGEIAVVGPDGRAFVWTSEHGRTIGVTDPLGRRTAIGYAEGRPATVTLPSGATWRWRYDPAGRPLELTDPVGGTRRWTWDEAGDLVARTTPGGTTWRYTWDRHALVAVDGPTGPVARLQWDEHGALVSWTGPLGRTVRWTRGEAGEVRAAEGPEGQAMRVEWDPAGLRPVGVRDGEDRRVSAAYDGNDRLVRVVYGDGATETIEQGCCAPVARTDPNGGVHRFERDDRCDVVTRRTATGAEVRFEVDARGRVTACVDPWGRRARMEYDEVGRRVAVAGPGGEPLRLRRDTDGHVVSVEDAAGHAWRIERDAVGRPVAETDPLGRRTAWTFDGDGHIVGRLDARGQEVRWERDVTGRVREIRHGGRVVATFVRDEAGRVVRQEGEAGDVRYGWDKADRLVALAWDGGEGVRISRDRTGAETEVSGPPGFEARLARDARGDVRELSVAPHTLAFTRDRGGHVVGIERDGGRVRSTFARDADGRLVRVAHEVGGTPFYDVTVARDRGGLPREIRGLALMTAAPVPRAAPFASAASGELLRAGGAGFVVDAAGNRVGGPGWEATYDADQRLVRLVRDGVETRFGWDAFGWLVRVERGGVVRRLHRDPSGRVLIESEGGRPVARWVHVGITPVARVAADGSVTFCHLDPFFHTAAVTDGRGDVVAAFAYDPWGRYVTTGAAGAHPFTFGGGAGVYDLGGGLYAMGRRVYDAETGVFLQRDPLGIAAGLDPYAYCGRNPYGGLDPRGEQLFPPAFLLVGGVLLVATLLSTAYSKHDVSTHPNSTMGTVNAALDFASDRSADNKAKLDASLAGATPGRAVQEAEDLFGTLASLTNFTPLDMTWSMVQAVTDATGGSYGKAGFDLLGGFPFEDETIGLTIDLFGASIDNAAAQTTDATTCSPP